MQSAQDHDHHQAVFDVISIRPSKPGGQLDFGPTPGGYQAHNTPLFWVIMDAYFPRSMAYWRGDRLLSSPSWVLNEQYDIEAKVDEEGSKELAHMTDDERHERLRPMLQAMLEDRCHLLINQVATKGSVYALIVSPHGPHFKTVPVGITQKGAGIKIAGGGAMRPITLEGGSGHEFYFTNTSMAALAEVLSGLGTISDLPVEDRTNLSGKYNFLLHKNDEDSAEPDKQSGPATAPEPATLWNIGAIGLELKRIKAITAALVVSHIDRPSPN